MTKTKTKRSPRQVAALKNTGRRAAVRGQITRDGVVAVLTASDQPLVAREVQVLLAERGMIYEASYVKDVLDRLVADGRVSSRPETTKEQQIRKAADGRGNHFQAVYYWAPAGKVPARTAGALVQTGSIATRGAKQSLKKKKKQALRPAPAVAMQTGSNPDAIAILIARITELETQLAEIRRIAR